MLGRVTTVVYTDGACIPNPGPGGWAWAVPDGPYASGHSADSTNQRMELMAAMEALKSLPGTVEVRSDSTYVVKCFSERWYLGWEAKGWKNAKKRPVDNQDLWRPMVELFHRRANELTFTWIKGHSDDLMNDLVDRLAVEAASTQSGRSGSGQPADLGPADRPGARSPRHGNSKLEAIEGWKVVVFGHRPTELGGYAPDNPKAIRVKDRMREILEGLRLLHPDLVVLTGLGLGAEMLGAEAANEASVAYVAVLAHPDPDSPWPELTRARYRRLLSGAAASLTMTAKAPRTKQDAGKASGVRNIALVSAAQGAIVVWDGTERQLATTVNSLEKRIADDMWIISPG